ncbi:hypothetical protein DO72_876 [Burkholderia pseudomallei]|nr:hypothetical protein DO72_876 [Burkholderia pseudomallei]
MLRKNRVRKLRAQVQADRLNRLMRMLQMKAIKEMQPITRSFTMRRSTEKFHWCMKYKTSKINWPS